MTPERKEAALRELADTINASEVTVFSIMDYWTFDGYLALVDFLERTPGLARKAVLPGIELRMEAPTDHRLNTHVVFDPAVSTETLSQFLANLRFGGPEGKPPSRENFIELARGYDDGKLRHHGYKPEERGDSERMHLLGMQTAEVTRESLINALNLVGLERYLVVQPYDTNDGLEDLDWKRHPYTDSVLMKWADVFETRDPIHVSLFLGLGHPTKPHVGREFLQNLGGDPKPAVSGSDAHRFADYGRYPGDRTTWLKAQPTFAGLRQVCHEPAARCFIGALPPKLEHVRQNPTRYITKLQVEKVPEADLDETWFDATSVELNPGLIAIIGNKGSGKSALADVLALAGNAHCDELEFLNERRFRRGANKARHFKATINWADGTPVTVTLDQEPDPEQPERIRYLPQQFIESLCNEIAAGNETNFTRELKKVVFSHVPEDDRLGKVNLDELIEYKSQACGQAATRLQAKLVTLNKEIVGLERDLSAETLTGIRAALSLKQNELDAHDKAKPPDVEPPKDVDKSPEATKKLEALGAAQAELEELTDELEAAKTERSTLVASKALLERLAAHLDNFESSYASFLEDKAPEFEEGGLELADLVAVTINREPLVALQKKTSDRQAEVAVLINGTPDRKGLEARIEDTKSALQKLQEELDAPQKAYQAYLGDLKRWETRRKDIIGAADKPDTVEFLKDKIKQAESVLPERLIELKDQRRRLVREIHAELLKIRQVYEDLYEPVQGMATIGELTQESLLLHFDAFLATSDFEDNFFDFIHRNKRGNFYGEEESRKYVEKIIAKRDFNSTDDTVAFVDDVMSALTTIEQDGSTVTVSIESQLKTSKKVSELYDFLFGLGYLESRYTLKLGGKDISQLSPGEKGALLLVFYLLLDREEIPIIIDQPEHNLDNESVVRLLIDCIRRACSRRQVIIVTHNPNLAVVCDADQIIHTSIDKASGNRISYRTGAIEDQPINKLTVDVLEGTYRAFDNRRRKYHRPLPERLPATGTETPATDEPPEMASHA